MIFRTDYIAGGPMAAAFLYDEDPGRVGDFGPFAAV